MKLLTVPYVVLYDEGVDFEGGTERQKEIAFRCEDKEKGELIGFIKMADKEFTKAKAVFISVDNFEKKNQRKHYSFFASSDKNLTGWKAPDDFIKELKEALHYINLKPNESDNHNGYMTIHLGK